MSYNLALIHQHPSAMAMARKLDRRGKRKGYDPVSKSLLFKRGSKWYLIKQDSTAVSNLTWVSTASTAFTYGKIVNGGNVTWHFGDGNTSTDNPDFDGYTFTASGTNTNYMTCDTPGSVTRIYLDVANVTSVVGLENYPSLEWLEIWYGSWPDLDISSLASLQTLIIYQNTGLTEIAGLSTLQNLYSVRVSASTSLTSLTLTSPSLYDLRFQFCTSLTSVNASGTSVEIATADGCTSLDSLDLSNTSLKYVLFDHCSTSLDFSGCPLLDEVFGRDGDLSQAIVDKVLSDLVSNGTTNGVCHLHGGTNAAPSAAGDADKATLQSRGWTVLTN